ncbi:MAG: DUF1816 domain-containing protein [Xenococcaceae cyanobacterium MO_207.B15]|nr:DUF1816 domain-containing protein [Xenococcaceae cyanobacterium MO_207.B15]MDJ0742382.1 DUF1816 domain-containing protein [Xenococcaceae cyanobacterium MO_167.B27]
MNYHTLSPEIRSPFKPVDTIKAELSWWVKITTATPYCIYYFGPFDSQAEATVAQYGYMEDLMTEKATGINIDIKQDQPKVLTISEED